MIKIVDVNEEQLNKLKYFMLEQESMESTVHPFYYKGEKKAFKLFKKNIDVENKVVKMKLLNERLKGIDQVITAEVFIRYQGKIIGYIMPFINGKMFNCLTFNRKKNILILKRVAEILKIVHKLNIVCADILLNVIVDDQGIPYLIDYDNFAIDDLKVDTKNLLLQEYELKVEEFDYHFDDYLLNLFTINILTKISSDYLKFQYRTNPSIFNFKDDEIRNIVENTLDIKDRYEEDLIVDKIESKKDLKKIKHKLF